MQRSRRRRAAAATPQDPASAAWAFVRPTSAAGGTGIAFLDAALRRRPSRADNALPVVEIRGDVGKTWTLVSLAARFVVATRPSQFAERDESSSWTTALPQVVVLDSKYDVTTSKLAYAVRSTLLRRLSNSSREVFERDMEDCLGRIHVATADDIGGWVPLLEALRCSLTPLESDTPTLVLWDGFLSEPGQTEASRMEVVRQLDRLVEECSVLVVTTGQTAQPSWERFVTHRIRLERNLSTDSGHEFLATVHGARIPFSISLSGVLS
jgi:hypothetical protein